MNNATLKNIMNGIAINAASNGDMAAVASLQQAAEVLTAIVPSSRTTVLAATAYDNVAASTSSFLTFAGLTVNTAVLPTPQLDSEVKTQVQAAIAAWNLGM